MIQELFFEIRRKKVHIFCDVKENITIFDLKCTIEGILNVPCQNQDLFRFNEDGTHEDIPLDNRRTLSECGFNQGNAKAQQPATLGLLIKGDAELEVTDLSTPPPIPDVMRTENQPVE